jgi:hypothetical protein
MTDYELILKCKAESGNQFKEKLFFRYMPFLIKRYNRFVKVHGEHILDLEDYQNEAYEWFLKAVSYVNPAKLTMPASWKFLTPYMWYLDAMNTRLYKAHKKGITTVSLYEPYIATNGETLSLIDTLPSEHDSVYSAPERLAYQTLAAGGFEKTFSPTETIIFEMYKKSTERAKTLIITSIANKLGCTTKWVYFRMSAVRKRMKTYLSFLQ